MAVSVLFNLRRSLRCNLALATTRSSTPLLLSAALSAWTYALDFAASRGPAASLRGFSTRIPPRLFFSAAVFCFLFSVCRACQLTNGGPRRGKPSVHLQAIASQRHPAADLQAAHPPATHPHAPPAHHFHPWPKTRAVKIFHKKILVKQQ